MMKPGQGYRRDGWQLQAIEDGFIPCGRGGGARDRLTPGALAARLLALDHRCSPWTQKTISSVYPSNRTGRPLRGVVGGAF